MLPLVAFFLAQSVGARVILPAASCDKLPSWSIKDFKVEFGACQGQNLPTARAYFTVSGTLSGGRSDGLSCSMRANSHCQIDGTPSDTNCHIYIQTYLDEYIVTINETMSCEGNPACLGLMTAEYVK
ncbi:hypothetical protein GQ53DRAFT_801457 [Thozetella sp. PMI_491]|nr:hypothetical protein GQ53DRAFT_801457 [Thozetella sp. PMI_491]